MFTGSFSAFAENQHRVTETAGRIPPMGGSNMTADAPRLRVTTNLAWGICLILFGTVLILDRLQLVAATQMLRFWPVGLVIFGAALVMQSLQRVDTAQPAQRHDGFNPGHVIVWVILALVFSQGFSRDVNVRTDSSATTNMVAVMSRHQQISSAPVFRAAEMTTIMGRAELDLRKTTVAAGEEAVIEVFTLMGGSTIRVPEGWSIDLRATPVMGGVRDRRSGPRDTPGAPRVVIRGLIMWGGLDIRS
jgi:predicted membrane protein